MDAGVGEAFAEVGLHEVAEEPDEVVAGAAGAVFPALGGVHAEAGDAGVEGELILEGDDGRGVVEGAAELGEHRDFYRKGAGRGEVAVALDGAIDAALGESKGGEEGGKSGEGKKAEGADRMHG